MAAIIGLCAALFAGCSSGGDRSPDRAGAAESQAAALVVRLDGLLRAGRYDQVCDELLTPRARRLAGGDRCARGIRVRTAGVTEPRVALQGVRASGPGRLSAEVEVASAGQAPVRRTVAIERVGRAFRIAGLNR